MENDDSTLTLGLLFFLAVAVIGLYLGAGSPPNHNLDRNQSQLGSSTGQVMALE